MMPCYGAFWGRSRARKPYRKSAFRGAMTRMWKVVGVLAIKDLEDDVFLFLFGD